MTMTVIGETVIDLAQSKDSDDYVAHPGGSPLNVAVGLARLGHSTQLMARISTSAFGRRLRAHAVRNQVRLDHAISTPQPATLAVVTLDDSRSASYDFYIDGTADWQWTSPELACLPPGTTALHTGSLATMLEPGARHITALVAAARRAGDILISFDPNVRPQLLGDPASARHQVEKLVGLAHVVKASHEDTAWLYPHMAVEDVARSWLNLGANLVVITSGAAGSLALTRRLRLRQPAFLVDVTDTVGAGDAYTAGLLSALVRREVTGARQLADLEEPLLLKILREAAAAAALTCARPGADPPTRSELESMLLAGQSPGAGT